jgi:uncharacterized peroxidase-related enzyme
MDIPIYTEDEATEDLTEIYDDIKRSMQLPGVPNYYTAVSSSPNTLAMLWQMIKISQENSTLPNSLGSMINYVIATESYCEYCSSVFELNCRTMGVNEDTLAMLIENLEGVNPRRIKVIIEFALKAAKYPQELDLKDYNRLRDEGVTDEEIVEIVILSAFTALLDVVADALKVEVDPGVLQGLGRDYVFAPDK